MVLPSGTPARTRGTPARGTPRSAAAAAAAGTKGTPMSAKRTPAAVKPVVKYKEAGCQTSPGFSRRQQQKQSQGDSSGYLLFI